MSLFAYDESTIENNINREGEITTETSEDMNCTPIFLENIKTKIESMSKPHHIEILRILKNNSSIKINENKNGIFVNLSFLPKNTIDEITKYIEYIDIQESSIMSLETKKEGYKTTYFMEKEDKDNTLSYNNLYPK
jgi:hypothetical protein